MGKDIKKLVNHFVKKYGTRDPFELADKLGILYQIGNIDFDGCYMYLKKHRYIFLGNNLSDQDLKFVMAHELGHAILHRTENCYFLRNKTLLSVSKIENEANTFAAELLIPDSFIFDNPGMTKQQLARLAEYDAKIMEYKKI